MTWESFSKKMNDVRLLWLLFGVLFLGSGSMLGVIWAGSTKVSWVLVQSEVEKRDKALEDSLRTERREEMEAMESRLSDEIKASALKTNSNTERQFEALVKIMTRSDPKFERAAIEISKEDARNETLRKALKR